MESASESVSDGFTLAKSAKVPGQSGPYIQNPVNFEDPNPWEPLQNFQDAVLEEINALIEGEEIDTTPRAAAKKSKKITKGELEEIDILESFLRKANSRVAEVTPN